MFRLVSQDSAKFLDLSASKPLSQHSGFCSGWHKRVDLSLSMSMGMHVSGQASVICDLQSVLESVRKRRVWLLVMCEVSPSPNALNDLECSRKWQTFAPQLQLSAVSCSRRQFSCAFWQGVALREPGDGDWRSWGQPPSHPVLDQPFHWFSILPIVPWQVWEGPC